MAVTPDFFTNNCYVRGNNHRDDEPDRCLCPRPSKPGVNRRTVDRVLKRAVRVQDLGSRSKRTDMINKEVEFQR